ncbi:hypothetical protein [Paraglaciecola chathamensis]|uniref:Uncharacterized protein n=1 Tax=Paraglaciecola agarilytica NO2 TaxID=1125747 RepID=A0ABQ0I398_9ALTE|nr:hypothetical protein [Paraglaciecola agarilytica]GAC03798.1 hypothetical protein GAGA_0935 [Paraglaciecola agarilytica NO2]
MKLSFEELELINRSLMTRRRQVEKESGQHHPDFTATAQLMDKLAVNNNGAELKFIPKA